MHSIKTDVKNFLFIPILIILCINTAYLAFGMLFFSISSKIFDNTLFSIAYIALIVVLNVVFYVLIVYFANKLIKNNILIGLQDFYNDMQIFYETNKNGFANWSERVITSPKEIVEIQRYFHNKIAKYIYDLHLWITSDSLTGLRTNIILNQDLEKYPNHIIAVLNISNFKEINSFYGVESADKILCSVANMLQYYFKNEHCLLYRIHGDDFAILWLNMDRGIFIHKLENFLDYLSKKEILIDGLTYINITATIGVAFSFDDVKYSMVNAFMALHHAKEYKNPIVIYNNNLSILNTLKNNIQYTELIYQALKNQDIVPFYQKIERVQGYLQDTKVKYEALMRIRDKEGHMILPGLFLEIAKRSSAYMKLSQLMIEQSFACLSRHNECIFSINLALEDMLSSDFSIWFMDRIAHYNLEGRVIVEITEQESIEDFDAVSNFITNIKELGVKIALDDFGSGYSNFYVLMKLQIDYLKIDGSLIKNIDKDKNARIIAETIIRFAKKLKILTIAEFVATKEIYEVVKEIGIDYAQGYYIGKPLANIRD